MRENKIIKVIVKEPGKQAEVREIEDKYENLSSIVDGLIEFTDIPFDGVEIICNEEYRVNQLPFNVILPEVKNYIGGTFLVVGSQDYDTVSVPEDKINEVVEYLNKNSLDPDADETYDKLVDAGIMVDPFIEIWGW